MENSVAIVTGAANGIGRSICQRLIKDGFYVLLVDIDRDHGEIFTKELGKNASFFCGDISKSEDVEKLFVLIKQNYDGLDVLINNAGIIRDNLIWNMPSEDFDKVIDINLKGTWTMCKYAAELMKEQQKGRIINISSRAWLGNPGQSNYAASKAGVIGMTRSLALELGRYGVYVNAIAPGLIDTPLTQKLPDHVKEKLIKAQPTRTMGKPEDIANVVSFLSQSETEFITGQTIYVDGGKSIGAGI